MSTVYVSFSAEINPSTTESLIAVMSRLANDSKVDHVYLLLSTPGGNVMNGMNLYNVLRGLPVTLTTHNVGSVNSIGNAVFLAGEHRYSCPQSTFMFHGVGFNTASIPRLEEKILREKLDSILSDQKSIGTIIQHHTSLSEAQVKELFREATTKDATFAVEAGIVDEIRDVEIPAGAPIQSLVFQR